VAGQLDLTLPDYATLTARAGVDPAREHRRVATANPEAIQDVARSFGTAGQGFTTTRGQGERAAATIGTSFTNDGAAVYGVEQHAARLPADFRSASTRLEASSGELAKVAADLGATRSETAGRVQGLFDELTRTRQAWAARVAGAGLLTPEQARYHPYSNVITRCVGAGEEVEADTFTGEFRPGDVFLVCSDGLTGMVDDRRLQQLLLSRASAGRIVDALIAEANYRGGLDNVTAVVVQIIAADTGDDEKTAEAPALQTPPGGAPVAA